MASKVQEMTDERRGNLTGVSEEALLSSPTLFQPNRAGKTTGLQQHFAPPEVSAFVAKVLGTSHTVVDLGAGDGSLLSAFRQAYRYGVEVDGEAIDAAVRHKRAYHSLLGDVQQAWPLLMSLGAKFDVAVCNPPFGLKWNVPGLGEGSSTALTTRMMRGLLREGGVGVLLCGRDRFEREVRAELGQHLFAVVEVARLFKGVALPTVLVFWREEEVDSYGGEVKPPLETKVECPAGLTEELAEQVEDALRNRFLSHWNSYNFGYDESTRIRALTLTERFNAVQEEARRRASARLGQAKHTVSLRGNRLSVHVSGYTRLKLAELREARPVQPRARGRKRNAAPPTAARAIDWLESFHGQTPMYFALQAREWARLRKLADTEDSGVTLQPALVETVEAAIASARKAAVPLYPVSPAQRLGFLTDLDAITCKRSDAERGFVAGLSYPIECSTAVLKTEETKPRETVKEGQLVTTLSTYVVERKGMEIRVGEQHTFSESPEDLTYILEHFEVPDPGDLAEHFPREVAFWRGIVRKVEREIQAREPTWRFRDFQVEDMVRMLVKGGGVLAWEMGLGKAMAQGLFVRALELAGRLPDKCALFSMPQDLVLQFAAEMRRLFGRELVPVANAADARRVREYVQARRADLKAQRKGVHLAPRPGVWVVTWFEALAIAGREDVEMGWRANRYVLERQPARGEYRKKRGKDVWVETQPAKTVRHPVWNRHACPSCDTAASLEADGYNGTVCRAPLRYANGRASTGRRKVCGHVERKLRVKPAYAVLANTFHAVLVDEGTKIKGDTSLTSRAVRALRARYRVLATGTPIKNFVVDLFWLLWWALGDSSARFPYAYRNGLERFTEDFAVLETRLDDETGSKAGRPRVQPEVTNLMRLWKMLCSSVVRRRMDEVGIVLSESGEWACKACSETHTAQVLTEDGRWEKPVNLVCRACNHVADAIVPLKYVPVTVPLGVAQAQLQTLWLRKENFVNYFKAKFPSHPLTLANGGDALITLNAAVLGQLAKLRYAAIDPTGEPDRWFNPEGLSPWTPGRLEVLRLAEASVREGKRVLIGSCHVAVGGWLAERLKERGIRAACITEEDAQGKARTLSPKKRAAVIADFRAGKLDVLCVSAQAVALGHNLDVASVFIGYGLPYDHAGWDQLLKRVRRLSSKSPVTAYIILPAGTVEVRVWAQLQDKAAAADLALDGRIISRREVQVDKAAILRAMQASGATITGEEVPESEVEALWHSWATQRPAA